MIRIALTAFAMFATAIIPLAGRGLTISQASSQERPFNRYYLAEFHTEVGGSLPSPGLCLEFTSSGTWFAVHSAGLSGTYLISGKDVFASATGNWSPQTVMSLQGPITRKGGSGTYVVSQMSGPIFSGGTFTLIREYSSGCS